MMYELLGGLLTTVVLLVLLVVFVMGGIAFFNKFISSREIDHESAP